MLRCRTARRASPNALRGVEVHARAVEQLLRQVHLRLRAKLLQLRGQPAAVHQPPAQSSRVRIFCYLLLRPVGSRLHLRVTGPLRALLEVALAGRTRRP